MSDYIHTEVVSEILKRLPVKALLRFRCVCKSWCCIISNPNFISQHLSSLSSSPTTTRTLVRHYSKLHSTEIYTVYDDNDTFSPENSFTITFPFHEKSRYYRVVGYCNGLFCLSNDLFGSKDTIILWNPSINRLLSLPKPSFVSGKCMFSLGFGFDSKSDDYKVVRFCNLMSVDGMKVPPKVEVYSVSLGEWRSVSISTSKQSVRINEVLWSQAVIDGVVHWNGFSCENGNKVRNLVLRFDLGSEVFGEIGLPEAFTSLPPTSFLVSTFKGSLSVVFYNDYMRNLAVDFMSWCTVWVMEEYGNVESWEQLYKIKLDAGLGMVIGTKRFGDDIFLSTNSGELVLFSCENGCVSSTGISGTKSSFFVDEYVESLVLMGKGEEVHGVEPEEDYETEENEIERDHWLRRRVVFNIILSKNINLELVH